MITADTMDGKSARQAMVDALNAHGGTVIGEATTPFGTTDFTSAMIDAKTAKPDALILNLYGWDLVNALKAYTKLELAKDKIGVGGMIGGEQIAVPRLCEQCRDLGPHLGPQNQYRELKAVHSRGDRQIQSHADVAMLSRLCGHDANS